MDGPVSFILEGPEFECKCCGQCCHRDPYYLVSLLDIHNISMFLGLSPAEFFNRYCEVVDTPGGYRYSAIMAPDGCPFLKGSLCSIHFVKPIGCWVFPESSLLPVIYLKKSVTAIKDCGILSMHDDHRTLKSDLELQAARDIHFEATKEYFEKNREFEEKSWREATERLRKNLTDAKDMEKRAAALRDKADQAIRNAGLKQ